MLMLVIPLVLALVACGATPTPTATPKPAPTSTPLPPIPPSPPTVTWCQFAGTGATIAIGGKRANFTCPRTADGDVVLLGDVEAGAKGWQITKAIIAKTDKGFEAKSSETVLVSHIQLADGTECAFAGTGATIAIEDKRANFTCPRTPDGDVVLLGNIEAGAKGGQIVKAVLTRTDAGFTAKASETALLKAIGVSAAN